MRTTSRCSLLKTRILWLFLLAVLQAPGQAQRNVLSVEAPSRVAVRKGGETDITLRARVAPGYHVNSHKPADEFLIPLKLSWDGPLTVVETRFPEPKQERYAFAETPLSVFTGDFDIGVRFRAPSAAEAGEASMTGRLRYQACTDKLCLPPKTVMIRFTVEIR